MKKICFVGNCSKDIIINKNGKYESIGGSCVYSSISCALASNHQVYIISNFTEDLQKKLELYNITCLGNAVSELSAFQLDESSDVCTTLKINNQKIDISEEVYFDHLHVSFRKGIDIDYILNNKNIKYGKLSIDVMIHSVESFIPYLKKYSKKIDYLFCNKKEFNIIKDYVENIPNIIITNGSDFTILLNKNIKLFGSIKNQNVISTTGAGDTLIGVTTANLLNDSNVEKALVEGIKYANESIKSIGPLQKIIKDTYSETDIKYLPKNIIVIGNSCAGKSTFVDYFLKLYNVYNSVDDLAPLQEMFMLDDLVRERNIVKLKELNEDIIYFRDVYNHYLVNSNDAVPFTKKSDYGHDIINPILWDMILERWIKKSSKIHNIIQFSRGKDELYEKQFKENVYERSLMTIVNNLEDKSDILIINLVSDLSIRKKRNFDRYKKGGHIVSEVTMETVYGEDIFKYTETDTNKGYILIDDNKYPVFTINNNRELDSSALNEFLLYNINEIINYYNGFRKENNYEFKRNTKTNMGEQSKKRI